MIYTFSYNTRYAKLDASRTLSNVAEESGEHSRPDASGAGAELASAAGASSSPEAASNAGAAGAVVAAKGNHKPFFRRLSFKGLRRGKVR